MGLCNPGGGPPSRDDVLSAFKNWWRVARKYAEEAWEFVVDPPLYGETCDFEVWWSTHGPVMADDEEVPPMLKEVALAAWNAATESLE
jgi:hypothetical protein